MKPQRIQRKRTKGWRMPENTVYVGRGSAWGNPFVVGRDGNARQCVNKYIKLHTPYTHRPPTNGMDHFLLSVAFIESAQYELKGKNLACWCKPGEPCHADFLLNIANED